jgi:hypothetical protein
MTSQIKVPMGTDPNTVPRNSIREDGAVIANTGRDRGLYWRSPESTRKEATRTKTHRNQWAKIALSVLREMKQPAPPAQDRLAPNGKRWFNLVGRTPETERVWAKVVAETNRRMAPEKPKKYQRPVRVFVPGIHCTPSATAEVKSRRGGIRINQHGPVGNVIYRSLQDGGYRANF